MVTYTFISSQSNVQDEEHYKNVCNFKFKYILHHRVHLDFKMQLAHENCDIDFTKCLWINVLSWVNTQDWVHVLHSSQHDRTKKHNKNDYKSHHSLNHSSNSNKNNQSGVSSLSINHFRCLNTTITQKLPIWQTKRGYQLIMSIRRVSSYLFTVQQLSAHNNLHLSSSPSVGRRSFHFFD